MDWQTVVALGCVAGATWSLGRRVVGLFRPGGSAGKTGCGSCGQCADSTAGDTGRAGPAGNFVPLELLGTKLK